MPFLHDTARTASVPTAPSPSRSCVWTRGPKETGSSLSWRVPRIAPPGCPPPVFAGCSPKTPHSCNGPAGCPRYTRAVCLPGGSVARGEGRGHGRTADSRSGLGLTPLRRVVWPNSPILHRVSNLPEKPPPAISKYGLGRCPVCASLSRSPPNSGIRPPRRISAR